MPTCSSCGVERSERNFRVYNQLSHDVLKDTHCRACRTRFSRNGNTDNPVYRQAIIISNVIALTKRERQIGLLLMEGLSHKIAANLLGIAVNTLENHLTEIYRVLNINSELQLALIMWWDTEGRFKEDGT